MSSFQVDLRGQTALVTGAGADLGRAIALALAQAGASVGVNDLNPDRVETVAGQIQAAGGQAVAVQGDVCNRFQASASIERTRDAFGRIHILVNAAGVYQARPLAKLDEWDWRRQVDVNLTGTFFMTQLTGRVMSDEGGGCIVNLGTAARSLAEGAGYIATNAGVIGLTQQAARELAPAGIRVNAVCPGNIAEDAMPPIGANLLDRAGTAADVTGVVLFLCSDAAAFMTGQSLTVDGGAL